MNIVLYITLLLLIILFVYCLFISESFINSPKFYDLDRLPLDKYDQNYEFVDKQNYNYNKDSKFINQYDNFLELGGIEYKNLKDKLEFKNSIQKTILGDEAKQRNIEYIKKLNRLTNYPLIKRELSVAEFDHILTQIKYNENYKYNKVVSHFKEIKMDSNLILSYKLVKDWIIEKISMIADEELYKMKFINNERFRYIEDQLLTYKVDYKNHLEHFLFKMRVYRPNKFTHFIVYFDMIFNNFNNNYYVNDLMILGTDIQENVMFSKFKNNYFKSPTPINHKDNIKIDNDEINAFIKSKARKNIDEYDSNYCFYKNAKNKNECISLSKGNNSIGIYDSPCIYNEDCPFYKKNTNYPNSRGGCKNGYCEMPTNVKLIGYKEYIVGNGAICYNCKKTDSCDGINCNMCCEDQKDSKLYPNLNSPDYSYPNDYNDRIEHSKLLEAKNISPINLIV